MRWMSQGGNCNVGDGRPSPRELLPMRARGGRIGAASRCVARWAPPEQRRSGNVRLNPRAARPPHRVEKSDRVLSTTGAIAREARLPHGGMLRAPY